MKTTARKFPFLIMAALIAGGCASAAPATDAGASPNVGNDAAEQRGAAASDAGFAESGPQSVPPAPLPIEPVDLPPFTERTLSNGASVIIVPDDEQPVVSINLYMKSGTTADPAGQPGVAQFTAALLEQGTETRTAAEIARTIDFVGGSLSAAASNDWTNISASSLTQFADTALVLLSDIVLHPVFPEEEVELERTRTLTGLRVSLSQPSTLAARRFTREVYGNHPYGRLLTPEAVESIAREDLIRFHRKHYRPGNALFVVAGDVEADRIMERLEAHFGDWTGEAPDPATIASPPERDSRELILIHKPGAAQAVIRMGHLMPPASNDDWIRLDVATRILGGGSSGWLFEVLRSQKGYTYGAYASASERPGPGYFQARAEVRHEVADSALASMLNLIQRLRTEPVPAEDLRLAKNFMTGSFPLRIETPQQVAGQIAASRLLGRPADYLENYRTRVAGVTAAEIQRVASNYLHPKRSVIVFVGDAKRLYGKLSAFGTVQLFDEEGERLTPADLEVKAADVAFDPSILVPQTLTYTVSVQDVPLTEVTTVVERRQVDGRNVVEVNSTSSGGMLSINSYALFDAETFQFIESSSSQSRGPTQIATELAFANGRITGTRTITGQEEQKIDVKAVPGTITSAMQDALIWLADFTENETMEIPVVNAASNAIITIELTLTGEESVTVPAGMFEAYVIAVSGGPANLTLYARKKAPHYVLRQEVTGAPVVIELDSIR